MQENSLWEQVGNKCLSCTLALLESETTPTAATVEAVKILVEIAVSIEAVNLHNTILTESDMASFAQWLSAAFLRHDIKQKRKAQGLSTDLKSLIAEYHSVCPEYADALEKVIYPAPKIASD